MAIAEDRRRVSHAEMLPAGAWLQLFRVSYARTPSFSLSFPSSLEWVRATAHEFQSVREKHFQPILLVFSLAYLYLQTFSIPGSSLLVTDPP